MLSCSNNHDNSLPAIKNKIIKQIYQHCYILFIVTTMSLYQILIFHESARRYQDRLVRTYTEA